MSIFGLPNRNIIKSKGQLLRDANQKIADLEREREWLKNRMAYLLVGVNALGRHSKLDAHAAKAVIDAFIKEQEIDMMKQVEVQKDKFKEDIKNGKMPEFTVLPNPEKSAE